MKILITGGCGFIGSHIAVKLIESGYDIIVLDNLANCKKNTLEKITQITNKDFQFYETDVKNYYELRKIFLENSINLVIHLAGLKSVSQSKSNPLDYFDNNVNGSINLFKLMNEFNVKKIIFSSSATVYKDGNKMPLNEKDSVKPNSPYGQSKLMTEKILNEISLSDNEWRVIILRYFNPVGAHKSGLIGENPTENSDNLFPHILKAASNTNKQISIFGDDYNTIDGTGVRDYIHVCDLANGHFCAVEKIMQVTDNHNFVTINLGSGKGYSVKQIISEFEKIIKKKINSKVVQRRIGDIAISYTDNSFAKKYLKWDLKENLYSICKDAWNWQIMKNKK
tara:strand:+ start:27 stop:1040 length:1014 start_codon:yes stop_codon:yes gene_type:complete